MSENKNRFYVVDPVSGASGSGAQGGHGSGSGGAGMEARIAKLEATTTHILESMTDLKSDIREIKLHARSDFRVLFGALIAVALGLAGLMARGFGWL